MRNSRPDMEEVINAGVRPIFSWSVLGQLDTELGLLDQDTYLWRRCRMKPFNLTQRYEMNLIATMQDYMVNFFGVEAMVRLLSVFSLWNVLTKILGQGWCSGYQICANLQTANLWTLPSAGSSDWAIQECRHALLSARLWCWPYGSSV